jgi:AraC family transcriptional regulator, regulatory protein of adaptative response / methylated-DNA-[protein]-cysteine methyltransferase
MQQQAAMDYERIERAIAFLQEHYLERPDLSTVARQAHLSEYHFQRLFSRWAGISPKKFLQFLTAEHAKQQLAESKSLLDVTFDAGLSSPGRLHDLFVTIEAVTPGEFKSRGAGLEIRYGFHPTRFGTCLLAVTDRGICGLQFVNASSAVELKRTWSGARCIERPDVTAPIVERIFSQFNGHARAPLSLLVVGTNFQVKVWQALLRIPPGVVASYETVGRWIGKPNASLAIGRAVAHNPIAYLIPCHRVIRKTGVIGDYRWGTARKQAMLAWESANC